MIPFQTSQAFAFKFLRELKEGDKFYWDEEANESVFSELLRTTHPDYNSTDPVRRVIIVEK
jgi:hypothetical protein